jgi:hypothetical protein
MKVFTIPYQNVEAEVYTDGESRWSAFSVHLQTGPVSVYLDKDADGVEHWKEEEYGNTELAEDLGKQIECCNLPFMQKEMAWSK